MSRHTGLRFDVVDQGLGARSPADFTGKNGRYQVDPTALCLSLQETAAGKGPAYILLNLRCRHLSLTSAYDIATALRGAARAGARVVAYAEYLDFPNLVALSHAAVRCCPPLAGPLSPAVRLRHFDVSGALSKLGVCISEFNTGPCKLGAVHFTAEGVPASILEQEGRVAADIFRSAAALVQEGTRVSLHPGSIFVAAAEAAQAGLLTHVIYEELLGALEPAVTECSWAAPSQRLTERGRRRRSWFSWKSRRLAVLELTSHCPLSGASNIGSVAKAVTGLSETGGAEGVLMIIDYQGGDLSDADRLWCLLTHLRRRMPVVAYVRTAMSAGYCVASAANEVVVNPCAVLGSIGAMTLRTDASGFLKSIGVDVRDAATGDAVGDALKPENDAERSALRRRAQLGSALFQSRIGAGRGLDEKRVAAVADGRLFTGQAGVECGLADQTGTLDVALDRLTRLTKGSAHIQLFRLVPPPPDVVSDLRNGLSLVRWLIG